MNRWTATLLFALIGVGLLLVRVSPRAVAQSPTSAATSQGTAFTYQGQLKDGGSPANGSYDFQFKLYDDATAGSQVGSTITVADKTVTDGLFTVQLDFGSGAFDGNARWLEIAVRPGTSTGGYTTLSPRQALTATPYALYSLKAPWSGLTGVPAGFADGVDDDTLGGLSCTNGQVAKWNGSAWACSTDNGSGGNITAVNAGPGLTGGGTSGDVTLSLDTNYTDNRYWRLTGNVGTTPGTHFLGTTDNVTLTLRVSNTVALRLVPTTGTPNLIGGYSGNSVASGVVGATIAGGGASGTVNQVTADYAVVGGGNNNTASGQAAIVGGGIGNTASGYYTTVSGGWGNTASDTSATVGGGACNRAGNLTQATCAHTPGTGRWSTVSGGINNLASGYASVVGGGNNNTAGSAHATVSGGSSNTANNGFATVGGGESNTASGSRATVGGGASNTAGDWYATVGGGRSNTADGWYAAVGGGWGNTASGAGAFVGGGGYNGSATSGNQALAPASTIAGGYGNVITATASYATVSGGGNNKANNWYATVGGGQSNTAGNWYTTVGGGYSNDASGYAATIPGGYDNTAVGDYSFAAGQRAYAGHAGSFVWGDSSTNNTIASPAAHTFIVRASGGIWLGTTSSPTIPSGRFINTSTDAYLSTGGAWTNASDRNAKENFQSVDPQGVLEKVAQLPITTWNYKAEDDAVRHIGPTAQDFYATFSLGDSDKAIATVDADGVALAAIQGLYQWVQELEAENQALREENANQQAQIDALEARLAALEQRVNATSAPAGPLSASGLALGGLALVGAVVHWRRKEGGR